MEGVHFSVLGVPRWLRQLMQCEHRASQALVVCVSCFFWGGEGVTCGWCINHAGLHNVCIMHGEALPPITPCTPTIPFIIVIIFVPCITLSQVDRSLAVGTPKNVKYVCVLQTYFTL